MLTITDGRSLSRALRMPLDLRLKRLLIKRRDQLGGEIAGHARFVVFEPGSRPCWLEATLGFDIFLNAGDGTRHGDLDFTPGWEWIEDHGHCFELCFVLDDSGFAHVVIVENAPGVHREVLEFCAEFAGQHA